MNDANVVEMQAVPRQAHIGLCASCAHVKTVPSSRGSVYYLCQRSASDPRFPRYPALPVIACPGYSAAAPQASAAAEAAR